MLCHGDFTPSQVLLAGDHASAESLISTLSAGVTQPWISAGSSPSWICSSPRNAASRLSPSEQQLADSFLAGYGESAGVPVIDRVIA